MTQHPENLCNGRAAAAPAWKALQSGLSLPQKRALCFMEWKICSIFLLTVFW